METIGIIGVGNIGGRFARALLEAGHRVVVRDLDAAKVEAAAAQGAEAAATPADVAARAELVLLCLPGSPPVEAVMEGPEGLLAHLRPGHIVVDTGTTHPDTDVHYAHLSRERGAAFLDAPITGRSQGFIMMVGGDEAAFARARPVLERLSYKLVHLGAIGRGQLLKLANQLVLAGQWAVWAEAVVFAEQAGLDPRLLRDCLEFPIGEQFLSDDFAGGGTLALHYKDLEYAMRVAHRTGAPLPLTNAVHEAFKGAWVAGHPDWSQPGVVTHWRRLARG